MAIKPVMIQRRLAEIGRIRIGHVVPTQSGKTRPAKLDRLRFTSPSRELMEKVAAAYGGTVEAWTPANGGAAQWEVISTSARVPVVVPPGSVTQFMETWSGGGCQRRCDGETEMLSSEPCLCIAQDRMTCKPTTRLSVMLRDIEGMGVFRLESHGWNAAAELPGIADFLAQAGGYIPAFLYLKAVRQVKGGETRDFMVPALEVEGWTPGQALAAGRGGAQLSIAPAGAQAIETATVDVGAELAACQTPDDAREVWRKLGESGHLTDQAKAAVLTRVAELTPVEATVEPEPRADPQADEETAWAALVAVSGAAGWTSSQLKEALEAMFGKPLDDIDAAQMAAMAEAIQAGDAA